VLFRRITVRSFRKLVSPVVINGLGPGVTIIAGDNEEGKSTLLLAIRAGLFERHNLGGKAVEAMQPFGSSVRPEIQLDFDIDGESFSITKGFAHRPSACFSTPRGVFEGPVAEEQLAELLTFRVPQRGESRLDDRGILGLFWLEQGHVADGLGFGEIGRSTLRSSLEQEVGDVLGGARGRRFLEVANEKRDAFLTSTGRPRGELAAAIGSAETATERVAELEAERQTYDREIDDLARVRCELARIDSDKVLERAQEALAVAEEQAKAIEQLEQRLNAASQEVALAEAQAENAGDRWSRRLTLIKALADREETLRNTQATVLELEKETPGLVGQLEAARANLAAAIEARNAAERRVAQSQSWAQAKTLDDEIADLDRRLIEVDQLALELAAARDRLTGIKIDKRAFEDIQRHESAMREARAGLQAIATRVYFSPTGAQKVKRGEDEILVRGSIEVTEATCFILEGFGRVEIEPGASELTDRCSRFAETKRALGKALAAAGVEDADRAKCHLEERIKAEHAINETNRLIAVYAPEGLNALREVRKEKSALRRALEHEYDLSLVADVSDPRIAVRALASINAEEETARKALGTAERLQQENSTRLEVAKQTRKTAEAGLAADREGVEAARAELSDADLHARWEAAKRTVEIKKISKDEAEKRHVSANPEEIELRRKRAEATLNTIETEQRRLREAEIGLESRLAALGKNGIGELLGEARERASHVTSQRDRLQSEACAWDLLVRTLSGAERDAKEAFLAPILKTIDPYLRLVLPSARLALDEETLEITGVTRDGRDEPYATLSVGTREQLSILVRLAFAVYLREKGYPTAVILDDALVYADDDRFERMQLALRKAAETVQILVLTCRPRDWRQFGAPIRRLGDVTAPALQPA
jgi:hypothetical protein